MANKDERIITSTARKVIVRIDRIKEVLTEEEAKLFNEMIDKMRNGVQ